MDRLSTDANARHAGDGRMRNRVAHLLLLAGAILGLGNARVWADGGTLQLVERHGDVQMAVFTAPNPLRAGTVDVSVLLQDAVTGRPLPEIPASVELVPSEGAGTPIRAAPESQRHESVDAVGAGRTSPCRPVGPDDPRARRRRRRDRSPAVYRGGSSAGAVAQRVAMVQLARAGRRAVRRASLSRGPQGRGARTGIEAFAPLGVPG